MDKLSQDAQKVLTDAEALKVMRSLPHLNKYTDAGCLEIYRAQEAAILAKLADRLEDSERYRHIRAHSYVEVQCSSPRSSDWRPEYLDAAIDQARKA